jgi:hypothetical protein
VLADLLELRSRAVEREEVTTSSIERAACQWPPREAAPGRWSWEGRDGQGRRKVEVKLHEPDSIDEEEGEPVKEMSTCRFGFDLDFEIDPLARARRDGGALGELHLETWRGEDAELTSPDVQRRLVSQATAQLKWDAWSDDPFCERRKSPDELEPFLSDDANPWQRREVGE